MECHTGNVSSAEEAQGNTVPSHILGGWETKWSDSWERWETKDDTMTKATTGSATCRDGNNGAGKRAVS